MRQEALWKVKGRKCVCGGAWSITDTTKQGQHHERLELHRSVLPIPHPAREMEVSARRASIKYLPV